MQAKIVRGKFGKNNSHRILALASAMAALGLAREAYADAYNVPASASAVAEKTSVFTSQFFDIGDEGAPFPGWGVVDFPSSGVAPTIPAGQQVNFVGSDLTVNMAYDSFSNGNESNSVLPITLDFYLATDTTTSITATSPLKYIYNQTTGAPAGDLPGGLNNPGDGASAFAAGTFLYPLGSAVYPGTATATAGELLNFSLPNAFSNSTVANYVKTQINTGSDLRLVIASEGTGQTMSLDVGDAEFYGPGAATAMHEPSIDPSLALDLTLGSATSNSSSLYVTAAPQKSLSVTLGSIPTISVGPQGYCILKDSNTAANTVPVTLINGGGGTSPSGNLTYKVQTTTAHATVPGPNDVTGIVPGGSDVATFGFTTADTNVLAGSTITASANFVNQDNAGDSVVNVTSNAVHVLEERFVDSGGTWAPTSIPASDVGKVLVGTTATTAVPITTTNTDTFEGDESLNSLTQIVLKGNQSSVAYTPFAPFSTASPSNPQTEGTISATTPSMDQTFDNAEIGTVNASVVPAVSGDFGNGAAENVGTASAFNNASYTEFDNAATGPETVVVGSGLTGETDTARVYIQWEGYQVAQVSGNNSSPISVGGPVSLTNIATNDDIVTAGGTTQNLGQRAAAWVTGITPNQTWSNGGGWSLTGITAPTSPPTSAGTTGTIIMGSQSVGDSMNYTVNGSVAFTPTVQMINGTYGGTITVGLENEQDIQGATSNDLQPVVFNVQGAMVSQPSGNGTGTYTLNAGTLAATSPTALSGSFTQSGGSSTFGSLADTGTVAINGGSVTVSSLSISGSGKMVLANNVTLPTKAGTPPTSTVNLASVSIIGNGTLDIGNNHIIIDYTPGNDPIASIAALIDSGANLVGGVPTWTGHGITSAAAQTTAGSYGIGYADAADPGNPAGLQSGQIEVMYTLLGDANLDGKVNGTDFNILATNFNTGGDSWDQGDFTYDTKVNGSDFNLLAQNFNQGATLAANESALDSFASANGLSLTSVPEPASLGALAISGIAMLSRRKRRSTH